ncbi:MAG TPA: hypothetical protein DCR14_19425 [Acidimicrobiaceae bacterium]|nr:hypothetical protein [Acidimicrobiaceae bacterium]
MIGAAQGVVGWARAQVVQRWYLVPVGVFLASRVMLLFVWVVLDLKTYPLGNSFRSWDGGWYTSIARYGYVEQTLGQNVFHPLQQLAFLPVVPFGARAISEVTPLGVVEAAALQSLVAGCIGVALLWRVVERRLGADVATASMTFLVFSPSAYVLSMFYTESMSLLLVGACFWALDHRRWWLVGVAGLLAGLTRPTGFLLVVPCLVVLVGDWRDGRRPRPLAVAASLASPLAFGCWVLYVAHRTGDLFGYFDIQRLGWGTRVDGGVASVEAIWRVVTWPPATVNELVHVLAVVVLGGLGLVLLRRTSVPPEWWWYAVASVLLTVVNAQQTSGWRYLIPTFPLFVGWMARTPRTLRPTVVAMSAMAMGLFATMSSTPLKLVP